MANKKPGPTRPVPKAKAAQAPPAPPPAIPVFPFSFNVKLIILAVLSFVLYADTLGNVYALDDGIVIEKNQYVQEGFGGIGKIMTTDSYDSYYREMNATQQLAGGRYRPLSEVLFAIEHTIFGESKTNNISTERHFVSVLFFVLAVLAIFYFLSKYLLKKFRYGQDMAFFAAILFAIHPIHTEVVANVKSIDETMSILFIALTCIFFIRYVDTKKWIDLAIGTISYFFSLLAKEYAIMLIFLLPMLIYLLRYKTFWDMVFRSVPYAIVLTLYMGLRGAAVGFLGRVDKMPPKLLLDPGAVTNIIYTVMLITLVLIIVFNYKNKNLKKLIFDCLPFMGIVVVYMAFRDHPPVPPFHLQPPPQEILNDPFLVATHAQKVATELFVLGKYLWLLILPYPLVSDYSYCVIPYQNPGSIAVLFVVLLYIVIAGFGFWLLRKKNPLAFAVFFYLLTLAIISNLLMDIGGSMYERLIFHASLGFVILAAYGLFELIKKFDLQKKRIFVFGLTGALVVVFGYETMARNLQWKSDVTLFTHDVRINENSTMLNGNAGARYIQLAQESKDSATKRKLIYTAISYLRRSVELHVKNPYVSSYVNLGDAYFELQMPDSAEVYWNVVKSSYPNYPQLPNYFALLSRQYFAIGTNLGKLQHNFPAAVNEMYKAIRVNPKDPELWYNLGVAYGNWGRPDSAYRAWTMALKIKPDYPEAKAMLDKLISTQKGK